MNPPTFYQAYMVIPMDHPSIVSRRRFWQFLACAFLFFVAMYLLHLGNYGSHNRLLHSPVGHGPYKYGPWQCSDVVNWTMPADRSGELPYHAQASVTLPISAEELHFVADGSLQYGDFEVSQDVDVVADSAVVDIDVAYRHPDAIDEATVCRTHPSDDKWGLGIFTPHWRAPHLDRNLRFHVHLRLPAASPGAPLKINALTTHLPVFSHHFLEIADTVYFDFLELKSQDAPIKADSLSGNRIWVNSRNGVIRGSFTASTLLSLNTANAPISVSASLINGGESTTHLFLKTSNGRIEGEVSLISNTSSASEGNFHVVGRTSNAPLSLTFVDAPVDSSLSLAASTSNSPARVVLHKTYEGTFDLASSLVFRPEVEWSPVNDPTERDRHRRVRLDATKGTRVHGGVSWEEGGEDKGSAVIETTNSPLRLVL